MDTLPIELKLDIIKYLDNKTSILISENNKEYKNLFKKYYPEKIKKNYLLSFNTFGLNYYR